MKEMQKQKRNKKGIGVLVIILTMLYLLVTTAFAQSQEKTAATGITYHKDHLSYGDVWAFDGAVYTASNYSKKGAGVSYYKEMDESTTGSNSYDTNNTTKIDSTSQAYYANVKTNGYKAPEGTPMPVHADTRFYAGTATDWVPSPVDNTQQIPVITTTNTNTNTRYSVVPDTTGTYYVYAYSDKGTPTVKYAMLDSCEASIAYNDVAKGLPSTPLEFEGVGNNWYRARIDVEVIKWHAVELKCSKTRTSSSSQNTDVVGTGGQDTDMSLAGGGTKYRNYNTWSTSPVYYNTVLVFQFTSATKLGPITKASDTLTITNPDTNKGTVTAKTIFGEDVATGTPVVTHHCPVIISGEGNGDYMLNEVQKVSGSGQLTFSEGNYIYPFEDASEISVSWTKLVNLPSIAVAGGPPNTTMNFFGAKAVAFDHPGGVEKTYTFTANFDNTPDLRELRYSYIMNGYNGSEQVSGILSEEDASFSISNVCYNSVVVTFTAEDTEGDTYTATCTITMPSANADNALFKVGNNYYWRWEEAVSAAVSGSNKTVVLVNNCTLPGSLRGNGMLKNGTYVTESGGRINYRLPGNVTFVAPYDATGTSVNSGSHNHPYANEKQRDKGGHVASPPAAVGSYVYLELTVASGATINLEGSSTLAVGGNTDGACMIYGDKDITHSNIYLEEGAEIHVASSAHLSSCGYIYGEGTVTAESGSQIYMPFSALDFHGGGYTVGASGKLGSTYGISKHPSGAKGLSPFIRYCMNAIQAKLVIRPGATVTGYLNLSANEDNNNTTATIIGSGSNSLIQTGNGTIVEITYDPNIYARYSTVGRTKIKIDGNASFGSLAMTLKVNTGFSTQTVNINTADADFPLPYNYDIEIAGGEFSVPHAIMLLPGARVTVDEGATLKATAALTVYDGLHDYTYNASTEHYAVSGWQSGSGNPQSQSSYTTKGEPSYFAYPSTADLQGTTFGGSGSADLIVNGTLRLESGAKIGGVVQTGSSGNARIETVSGIGTSTITQIGVVGDYTFSVKHYYFAGATVHELTGEVLDTATGERTAIVGGKTYYPSAGAGNISSYKYTMYYDSYSTGSGNNTQYPHHVEMTEDVACILQGSWYNYTVNVHTVKDGEILETVQLHFAHGADVSQYYTTAACTTHADKVTNNADLYFKVADAEAKIVWADGSEDSYYASVRNAVQDAVHEGDRVMLLKDVTGLSAVIAPVAGQDFIFDLNGKTLSYRATPFSTVGGKLTVDVNGGRITNVVDGRPYDVPVLSLNNPNYALKFLLNGGTVSVTGTAGKPISNGGVENAGNLLVDLGGGTWEYKTGVAVSKSTAAANQHHDLTVLAAYQNKAVFNNSGTLTVKDSKGGGKITTDLLSNGTTFTAATPTTNYVSIIRNNAGAKLYLGGGELEIQPKEDKDGDAILSTAATPVPMVLYSAGILNFGDIMTCDDGTALSIKGSGSYLLYNFKGGTVDLDLRGGTSELALYEKGVAANAAMYRGKAAVVNDGSMNLRDSTRAGKILMTLTTTADSIYGVNNNTNSAYEAVLTIEGINIETTQTLNNNCYGVYNGPAGTITSIKNCKVSVENGQALRNYGSNSNAALKAKISDITGSEFIAGGASVAADGVVGSHAFYNYYACELGSILDSTFQSAGGSGLLCETNALYRISMGDITNSNFEGVTYGLSTTYTSIGHIKNSNFTGGTKYALGVGTNSTIKSITGGKVSTKVPESIAVTADSGGLYMVGTAQNKNTGVNRVLATIGGITGTRFDVDKIGINIGHADIGNLDHVIIKTQAGNGITAVNGCVIGNITGCEITSGVYDEETGTFTTGSTALSTAGVATTATADAIDSTVGNITDSIFVAKTHGVSIVGAQASGTAGIGDAAGAKVGDIIGCTFHTGSNGIHITGGAAHVGGAAAGAEAGNITGCTIDANAVGINIAGGAAHATGGGAAAPTVKNITGCTINAGTTGISIVGYAGNTNFPEIVFATVGDITGDATGKMTVKAKTSGISLSYANMGKIENCELSATTMANNTGVLHVINRSSVVHIKDTGITVEETVSSTNAAGIYTSGAAIGDIIHCELTGFKGPAISHTTTAALGESTIGNITGYTVIKSLQGGGISAACGAATASAPAAAVVFGDIENTTTIETGTYGINMTGGAAGAGGAAAAPRVGNIQCTINAGTYGINMAGVAAGAGGAAAAPRVGNIQCTINAGSYGINIGGVAANASGAAAGPTVGNITCTITTGTSYGIQITGGAAHAASGNQEAFATVGDITGSTINSGTYSLYLNYCKGGAIEDCHLNAVNPAQNTYVLGNYNGSEIKCIRNTSITVTEPKVRSYGIYNNGGEIGLIENSPIDAPYGIYNLNVRGNAHTVEGGATILFYGHIGTIRDTNITVAQYAIANRGVIDEIVGKCTFKATNPSAQVPWDHGAIANSNAAANTVYNYNTWWGSDSNAAIWKQTDVIVDGVLTRTVEYKWEDEYRPTIGKISGDIKIIAENTSNNTGHGVAMINNGVIHEISGNVVIETYVHPENNGTSGGTPPAYSAYALQNTAGGRIDKIIGNVKLSAGAYAIQNISASTSATTGYAKTITTYVGETATSGQETSTVREYHWDYVGIGEITGDKNGTGIVIEATHASYALENHAHIGDITGKVSITADNGAYAIQNTTTTTTYAAYDYKWPGLDPDGQKTQHDEFVTATIGTIGGSDSEILIRSASSSNNTYTLQNNGRIEAIINATVVTTVGNTTTPAIYNAEASYTVRDSVYTGLGYYEEKSWYDTVITRDYVYERSSIGRIDGVTVTTEKSYALRNAGDIGSITNSSFTAATGYGIDNVVGGYAPADGKTYSRESVHYYHGTTALAASTQYLGETNIWYTRKQATIGLIDNVDITVLSGNYGIQNGGIIDKITNSTITVSAGSDAIGNTVQTTMVEDVSMMDNYIYRNASGNFVVNATITDKVWNYGLPTINFIGEGNTIQAAAKAIENKGVIGAIGDEAGKRTTITATSQTGSNQQAIYNYDGTVFRAVRDNSTTTVNTYTSATIGTIKNVSVSNGITPAIQNGSGTANYYPVIGEIGEGTEVHSISGMAVSNYTKNGATENAKIEKITGGIFTTEATGAFYALYNYSTVNPIQVSDGCFKSGTGDRAHAVYDPDNEKRYIYPTEPEEQLLSSGTKEVTFADGSTGTEYYFISKNVIYILFDGNGGTVGEMAQMTVGLKDKQKTVTLPANAFRWPGGYVMQFLGWSDEQYASEALLSDKWNGTVETLEQALGVTFQPGAEITLYAVWNAESVETCEITWGDMNFAYTRPNYKWDAWGTKYELTNPDEAGWHVKEGTNTVVITGGSSVYTATLSFVPENGYENLSMDFTGEDGSILDGNSILIPMGGEVTVSAMLTGDPDNEAKVNARVGTVCVTFRKGE